MNKDNVFFGVAPINWTNDDLPDLGAEIPFEQCISEMALAGYKGCEVGNKYPVDQPDKLRHMLTVRGLQICNQWFSMFLSSRSLAENIGLLHKQASFLQAMGAKVIGVSEQSGSIQAQAVPLFGGTRPQLDAEAWKKLCSGSNELGKIAREEYGICFCYHYHLGTAVESQDEFIRYLDGTNPEYVLALFDSGHAYAAGADVLGLLRQSQERLGHIHLKDVRPEILQQIKEQGLSFLEGVRRGLFTVPGDAGSIDFAAVFAVLKETDYRGWIVVEAEQDPARANPFEYARQGREFIRQLSGF